MFENLNKTVEEGSVRWEKIEKLYEDINNHKINPNSGDCSKVMAELLVLLVEHMRPMNPTKEQLGEATKGIEDLLDNLSKQLKKTQ